MALELSPLDSQITYWNYEIINTLPESVAKTAYIDLPICVATASSPRELAQGCAAASLTYEIRSQARQALEPYITEPVLRGAIAGA